MEENVRQELDALEMMVFNWKQCYLGDATPDGNNDYLVEEFQEEIETYMAPYLRRLFQCEHLTAGEAEEFLNFCHREVEALRTLIWEKEQEVEREAEPPPAKLGIWQKVVQQTGFTWRKSP
jgi:vacuolar-type H+-ATPase subunit C/Vma6